MGYPHPDVLLRQISAAQLTEWMAYAEIEPWGFGIENFRTGQIAATIANFSECSKRHDYKASDFAPQIAKPASLADRLKAAFGAVKKG